MKRTKQRKPSVAAVNRAFAAFEASISDGSYVINGAKMWITNGSTASVAIVWAKTDDDRSDKSIRGFIVEREFKGFETTAYAKGFGLVSATPLTRSSHHAGEDFARPEAITRAWW